MTHDDKLLETFTTAGVRCRPLGREEHLHRESVWRAVFGNAFAPQLRRRNGPKAVHEFLRETPGQWLLVPFLARLNGTDVNPHSQTLSAFDCEGTLLALDEFCGSEFFVAPHDHSWTFVRTHEDYMLGGPYFVRREWLPDAETNVV